MRNTLNHLESISPTVKIDPTAIVEENVLEHQIFTFCIGEIKDIRAEIRA